MSSPASALAPTAIDDTAVRRLVPVGTLPSAMRAELTAGAMVYDLQAGGRLDGGEPELAESLFLVAGSVELHAPGEQERTLVAGTGEACYALYGLSEPGAHLLARSATRLLQLDRALLSSLLICVAASDELADQPWLTRLLAREPFSRLPPAGLYGLSESLERLQLDAGELVYGQYEPAGHYYLLASGRCAIEWQPDETGDAVTLATVVPGDGFGEEALIADMQRTSSVRTLEPCTLLRLTREQLDELMNPPPVPRCSREEAERLVAGGAFWLDVRLPEEHAHAAPDGSVNMPLGALRNGIDWLDADSDWIVFCNAGRRSEAAAAVLAARGFSVRLLEGGLFGNDAGAGVRPDLGELQAQRLRAEEALEAALRESAAADAAAATPVTDADPEATARAAALREAATRARATLDEALRRKLELDTQWRNLEAEIRARHERAQAETTRLRNETEQRLRAERERLSNEASEAARAMQALRAERKQMEARFLEEQRALNERMLRERQAMEAKARAIREEMQRARQASEQNLQRIRSEHGAAERQLARDAETRLAGERRRLQEEISGCLKAQAEARAELEKVEALQQDAARLAEEARRRAQAEQAAEREQRIAELRAEQARLAEAARAAEQRLEEARRRRAAARDRRDGTRPGADATMDPDAPSPADEANALALDAELAVFESQADGAERELEAAEAARDAAERAHLDAETQAAQAQANEEELRLRLYEELEEALATEREQTGPGAEEARPVRRQGDSVHHAKGLMALHDLRNRVSEDGPLPADLLDDVRQLLDSDTSAEELRAQVTAQRMRLTQDAIAAAGEEKQRAREALERARQHLARLRERVTPPPSG